MQFERSEQINRGDTSTPFSDARYSLPTSPEVAAAVSTMIKNAQNFVENHLGGFTIGSDASPKQAGESQKGAPAEAQEKSPVQEEVGPNGKSVPFQRKAVNSDPEVMKLIKEDQESRAQVNRSLGRGEIHPSDFKKAP